MPSSAIDISFQAVFFLTACCKWMMVGLTIAGGGRERHVAAVGTHEHRDYCRILRASQSRLRRFDLSILSFHNIVSGRWFADVRSFF